MSGPHRNPDKLNTIGIVVVGICGSVLVYVTIVALQAFYQNDTSDIQTMADYGGNDATARSIKSTQTNEISQYGKNAGSGAGAPPASYRVPIDVAMKLVVDEAKVDPANLVPSQGPSDKPSIKPIFGRPQKLDVPPPADASPTDAGSAAAPADAGSAAPAAGSAAPAAGSAAAPGSTAAPTSPTGGQAQGGQTTGTPPAPDAKKGNAP
ncbi:MAG: hypothetical protein SFX73_32415 [Kofleriaceae bacterium]|nr:hypothetical protein [Kofleriaceae bacterium]